MKSDKIKTIPLRVKRKGKMARHMSCSIKIYIHLKTKICNQKINSLLQVFSSFFPVSHPSLKKKKNSALFKQKANQKQHFYCIVRNFLFLQIYTVKTDDEGEENKKKKIMNK